MESVFVLVFVLVFVGVLVGAAVVARWAFRRSRELVGLWAASNGYTLLEADRCWIWKGPFWWRSSTSQVVFRVRIRFSDGWTRRGHVRVGGWFLGLRSDAVTVHWDP